MEASFPDLDGLKPLERRILEAMRARGAIAPRRRKKCATFLEDVVLGAGVASRAPSLDEMLVRAGRHWRTVPNPYVAAYAALVDLAVPFRRRHPLIELVGNAGTVYGDPPADAIYTEARVSEYGVGVLEGSAPNVLLNGAFVDERSLHFIPYELGSVVDLLTACLRGLPEIDAIARHPLRPDFPTGDEVVSGLEEVQRTGFGELRLRGRLRIEASRVVVTALPFGVDHAAFLEELVGLQGLRECNDCSDRDGTRIVVEHARPETIVDALVAETSFEVRRAVHGRALAEVVAQTVARLRTKERPLERLRALLP